MSTNDRFCARPASNADDTIVATRCTRSPEYSRIWPTLPRGYRAHGSRMSVRSRRSSDAERLPDVQEDVSKAPSPFARKSSCVIFSQATFRRGTMSKHRLGFGAWAAALPLSLLISHTAAADPAPELLPNNQAITPTAARGCALRAAEPGRRGRPQLRRRPGGDHRGQSRRQDAAGDDQRLQPDGRRHRRRHPRALDRVRVRLRHRARRAGAEAGDPGRQHFRRAHVLARRPQLLPHRRQGRQRAHRIASAAAAGPRAARRSTSATAARATACSSTSRASAAR